MKINKKILLCLAAAPACLMTSCTDSSKTITIWVSEVKGVSDSFQKLAEEYIKNNNLDYKIKVVGYSEKDSATQMLTDVEAGADIFCFAQDQFSRLVEGGALSKLGVAASKFVTDNNTADSVKAVTSGTSIYAYPLTADNGYFMYYDKSVITDTTHLDSLEDLVKDCEAAGKKFSFEMGTSAWYMASFFFGTGCVSEWTADSTGKFTAVTDTFDSDNGVIAARGMQHLVKSDCHNSSSSTSDLTAATPSAILVSGTWAYNDVKDALGDNMGVADLPSFTVDGKSYHLGSYSGYKLMGVKTQKDTDKVSVLNGLAQYLTNEAAQKQRLVDFGWGPSNKAAQDTEEFKNNPALKALSEQNVYAIPQGNIHGGWWDMAKVVGSSLKDVAQDDVEGIKKVLAKYREDLNRILNMTEEELNAYTVIGSFATKPDGFEDWTTDLKMTESPEGTWTSDALTLTTGDKFKCRLGKSWTVAYGGADDAHKDNDGNFVVTDAEAGENKKIQLVVTTKDNVATGVVSII